jgi:hypothetical protein
MTFPRIYADFNGLDRSPADRDRVAIHLHYFGTLVDLCRQRVRLTEGLVVVVYSDSDESEDLEATGVVHFDINTKQWFAEFDESQIRYVNTKPNEALRLLCWSCGAELWVSGDRRSIQIGDVCASCRASIHEPLAPPDGA